MFDYDLKHIFSYTVTLNPPEVIGPVPEGARVNFYVSDGEATGPKVHGRFHPVGGDWLVVRTDGVGSIDVRYTIETRDEAALIYLSYTGVGELGEDGYERFLRGELSGSVPLRVAQRYVTAHPDYRWINRLQCLGIGEVNLERMEVGYDVYAVR